MPLETPYSRSYRRYALGGLTAIWTLNLVDRGLVTVLLQPIKVDLRLSDTQLGFLTGLAFAAFYAVAGIPLARLSDRRNRITIASLAIGVWGLSMMASLFVVSFAQLILARIAAATGEAGCKPPTYSLVGDYFPKPGERISAMAVYLTGSPIAALISFVIGGYLNERLGWRMTFAVMGIPGLLLAALAWITLKDPRAQRTEAAGPGNAPPLSALFRLLWQSHALRHLCAALVIVYGMGNGLASWYGAFLSRSHHLGTSRIGLFLGLIMSASGLIGVLLGGSASARLFASDEGGHMRLCMWACIAMTPCYAGFVMLPGTGPALAALFVAVIALYISQAPTYSLMQSLVPDDMRATMMAVIMLLVSGVGTGLGPQFVGILSDQLHSRLGSESLRYAMLVFTSCGFWAAYHFYRLSIAVGRSTSTPIESDDPPPHSVGDLRGQSD